MRTRTTVMTNERDSASTAATSLLGSGEVRRAQARRSLRANTDAQRMPVDVVGDGRSEKRAHVKAGDLSGPDILRDA